MEDQFIIRNQIKNYREKLNITQGEVAEYLGKSKSFISKIEQGKEKTPSLTLAFLIVEALRTIYKNKTSLMFEITLEDIFQIEEKGE